MSEKNKRLVEAALFLSGGELSMDKLCQLTGIAAPGAVKKILEDLKRDYDGMGSSIEIHELGNSYAMRVRGDYIEQVKDFAKEAEIGRGALRTLSYIANHDGMLKSDLANRMGSQIYQDVRELREKGFLSQRKEGRSSRLFLTDKFRQYFNM